MKHFYFQEFFRVIASHQIGNLDAQADISKHLVLVLNLTGKTAEIIHTLEKKTNIMVYFDTVRHWQRIF